MPEEFWIAIDQPTDVVDRAGKTVIGHLEADSIQTAIGSNEYWFMMAMPDGTTGFVPRSRARVVSGPPAAPPAQTPEPVAAPSVPPQAVPPTAPPAPAQAPVRPPPQPPMAAPTSRGGGRWIIALVIAVVAAVAGWYYFVRDDTLVLAEGEVFLEPANNPGPEVFTTALDVPDAPEIINAAPVVATVTTSTTSATGTTGGSGGAALPTVSGGEPGLYGGTQDASRCDPSQMAGFLTDNPDKGRAWIQGISADPNFRWSAGTGLKVEDIPAFLAELTPITLVADTRVTNNGYRDGVPTPRQAVLQAGTSVLVDTFGVPRAKCNCGNPLAPPVAQTAAVTYTGDQWDTFQPETTVVVQPSPTPLPVITIVDLFTGELIDRPAGTTGSADIPTGITISAPLVSPTAAIATTSTTVSAASTGTSTSSTTTTAPTTSTTAPSVLTSGDFCSAYFEYVAIDDEWAGRYDDPNTVPEYQEFLLAALTDLANLAPAPVDADWAWYRDEYARNPEFFLEDANPEIEDRFARMLQHLDTDCGLDFLDEG